jgi:poly(A) polymerase Pap1
MIFSISGTFLTTGYGSTSSATYSDVYTQPVSLVAPSARDHALTRDLQSYLQAEGLFENEQESQKREIVLGKLNMIVKEWIKDVSLGKVGDFPGVFLPSAFLSLM